MNSRLTSKFEVTRPRELADHASCASFRLKLLFSATIAFYQLLSAEIRGNFDELIEAFKQQYSRKPELYRSLLSKPVQQQGESVTEFAADISLLA